jgi:ubiquinone/menaquinone biosynthesis C-methylase UbiE
MFSEDRPQKILSQKESNRDLRRHIRMEHSGSVQLVGESRCFTGQAVNISRTGMQVVVNIPDSYESVRSITFALPNSDHAIELPCRIVRSQKDTNNGHGGVLGLEFSYQGEAQLLLIENYIREIRQGQLSSSGEQSELRQLPRTPCMITDVATDKGDVKIHSIDNISGDGLLIRFTGNLQPADGLWLYFRTPHDSKKISLAGNVVYVIENEFQHSAIAGIRLDDSGYMNEVRVRNFIISCHSVYAMKGLCDHLAQNEDNGEFQITEPNKILEIMSKLLIGKIPVNILLTHSLRIIDLRIDGLSRENRIFEMRNPAKLNQRAFSESSATYFSFMLEGGSYFFKTERVELTNGCITCKLPLRIFRTEKRSYRRKFMEFAGNLRLFIADAEDGTTVLNAQIIDMSKRGFLCQVHVPETILGSLRPGSLVKYQIDVELGLGQEGEVRHLKEISTYNRSIVVQLGIEAGIKRRSFVFNKVSTPALIGAAGRQLYASRGDKYRTHSIPVTYYNANKQNISGLVNTTRLHARTPVVVIPPAFGKKKESLSPFVTTLLYNFVFHHKDITVMRYDGVNRPGESYNEYRSSQRGYEMLRYKVSQGLDDLTATLDFIHNNPLFEATEVILLTFSMSAIDARKLLSSYDSSRYRIGLWISCMGVACAQSTIGNILAGIDIISNHKMGIPTGIHGMLGHILDMDRIAKDLIEKKYAYMTDSRRDFAKIGIPVLWIYGQHDKWVSAEEVHDIMSVDSPGHREVIELSTGHNLRTSDEAIQTFKLISNHIYKALFDGWIEPVDPPKDEILRMISYERERLEHIETFESTDYWRSYLIGENQSSSGYDFYKNLKEFRDFLSCEIKLLRLEQGNRFADMGCGTGLLLEAVLKEYMLNGHGDFKLDIEAVELVSEALEKTRQKCNSIMFSNPGRTNVSVHYHLSDLEPNRFIPVRKFIDDSELGLNFLRNRISGLKNAAIDKLLDIASPRLYEIMRGSDPGKSVLEFVRQLPEQSLRDVVVEFNRAARFVKRALVPEDFIDGLGCGYPDPGKTLDYSRISADALRFDTLDFGRSGLCFNIPFPDDSFDRIAASLLLSYLFNGEYLFPELYRTLRPGGILLVSSMKPDSDLSTIFTNYINDVEISAKGALEYRDIHTSFTQARAMLNEASELFELEEDGHFYFYSADELRDLFIQHGLTEVTAHFSLGDPAQAVIVTGRKPIRE